MKAIFNKTIIQGNTLEIEINDRAFQYGDSLFETAKSVKGEIPLLKYHFERINLGVQLLDYSMPNYFNFVFLAAQVREICEINKLNNIAKIKIRIWRKAGGNYTPINNDINYLITAVPYSEIEEGLDYRVDIALTVFNTYSSISSLKSGNALKYVLAGLEKSKRYLDDIIILDQNGYLSELIHSNIIWIKDNRFYTPSNDTGCIAGVMKSHIKERLKERKLNLIEGLFTTEALLEADHALSCNAMGIIPIKSFGNKVFSEYPEIDSLLP